MNSVERESVCLELIQTESVSTNEDRSPGFVVINKTPFKIGRLSTTDLTISRKKDGKEVISRNHAEIVLKDGNFVLVDLDTMNGTFINDIKIKEQVLEDGDIIQFAGQAKVIIGSLLKANKSDVNLRYRFTRVPSSSIFKEKRSKVQSRHQDEGLFSSVCSKKTTLKEDDDAIVISSDILVSSVRSFPSSSSSSSSSKLAEEAVNLKESSEVVRNKLESQYSMTSMLDIGTLKKSIMCILCTAPLVDAVVARCSHGFCRACFERYLRSASSSCPICNNPPFKFYKQLRKGKTVEKSTTLFYHRSAHLDNIVWLLLETLGGQASDSFKVREREDHEYLRSVGIDPLSNPGLYEEQSQQLTHQRKAKSSVLREKKGSKRNGRDTTACSSSDGDYSDFSDDSDAMRKKRQRNSGSGKVCEFCAESDHDFPNCPHRSSDENSSVYS